ncbi:MAG: glycoside hydrolase TIM-barrel-like domain-containing protein [Pseudomonadota bacterium]
MATLLLTAVGASVGGAFGTTALGLSGAVLGRAVGATLGTFIDQRLLGGGSDPVEVGRASSFRVQGSSEGAALPYTAGRMRIAGQVIWSTRYLETVSSQGGAGKGLGAGPDVREYSYSVSCAIGLCEGEIMRIGRVWADGQAFPLENATYRLYRGGDDQMPDPLIEAVEGVDTAPAYRGTAYLVFENLDLTAYGNRIPQFNIEVFRQPDIPDTLVPDVAWRPSDHLRGVALTPGTGEYALATTRVGYALGKGEARLANTNNTTGETDILASFAQLDAELPACDAVSLVVSWFGDDLRCDRCTLRPMVEQRDYDGAEMPWLVSGIARQGATLVSQQNSRPNFGGTPSDQSVIEAIRAMHEDGRRVMFYPFILMDIPVANGLTDPWTGASDQAPFPWRGRITLSVASGQAGSPDKSAAAASEVSAFFGAAQPGDFVQSGDTVSYIGTPDWGFRRFILHYAHLCAAAGGVEAFCIGSEMRSLTQIRDGSASYPAIAALRALAADVRSILGPTTKISYAADWSEYFGHQPADGTGDVFFHLDPLWSDPAIDFVGIDNYMPLSDWRDESGHADAAVGSIYDLDYLSGNVTGGEGFDWYYADAAARDAQSRSPISDTGYGEDWLFRYKDLVAWWSQPHHNRPGGVRDASPTSWVPQSKPIWFTEFGCPAVDKGTNQPNVFWDPKSSESFLPYYSTGVRDDYIQQRYLQAHFRHWNSLGANPTSLVYGAPMLDLANCYAWAWDARPWPDFPAREAVWADGPNYELGHWLQGRIGSSSLAELIAECCLLAGLDAIDVSAVNGSVSGFLRDSPGSARQALQPLLLGYAVDATESDGKVIFRMRGDQPTTSLDDGYLAVERDIADERRLELRRDAAVSNPDAVRVAYFAGDNDYQTASVEAVHPTATLQNAETSQMPVVFSSGQAQAIAERWLAELRVARDEARFALAPSHLALEAGDLVRLPDGRADAVYRIERIEERGVRRVEARRVETGLYVPHSAGARVYAQPEVPAPATLYAQFMDLPLLRGDEIAHAPWLAVSATPWRGTVNVYKSASEEGYERNVSLHSAAVVGETLDELAPAQPWAWSRQPAVRVKVAGGTLQSRSTLDVLNGANTLAVLAPGGSVWEVVQFQDAVLVGSGTYALQGFLRGQAGTEFLAGAAVPAGADIVLLDRGPTQIDLAPSETGLTRHFRVGPANLPYTDPSYRHSVERFDGIGLRPYAPVRLSAHRASSGDLEIAWMRRTRVGGDSWEGVEVPLAEEREVYLLRVVSATAALREWEVTAPAGIYTAAQQASDAVTVPFDIEVAQVSAGFGAGPFARITVNV